MHRTAIADGAAPPDAPPSAPAARGDVRDYGLELLGIVMNRVLPLARAVPREPFVTMVGFDDAAAQALDGLCRASGVLGLRIAETDIAPADAAKLPGRLARISLTPDGRRFDVLSMTGCASAESFISAVLDGVFRPGLIHCADTASFDGWAGSRARLQGAGYLPAGEHGGADILLDATQVGLGETDPVAAADGGTGRAIPRVFHFITGLDSGFGGKPFSFVHALAILSALRVNEGFAARVYYEYEPSGPYWDVVKTVVTPVPIVAPREFCGHPVDHFANRADICRLRIMIEHGGIYLDMDTICQKPFAPLLDGSVVMGLERTSCGVTIGLCNATIIAPPGAAFLRLWLDCYNDFTVWNRFAVQLPMRLAQENPHLLRVEPHTSFFWPAWDEAGVEALFARDGAYPEAYSFHLWESKSWEHLKRLDAARVRTVDTAYNRIARRFVAGGDMADGSAVSPGVDDAGRTAAASAEPGGGPGSFTFNARHPHWASAIRLDPATMRARLLANGSEGRFAMEGAALEIHWDGFAPERFSFVDGSFVLDGHARQGAGSPVAARVAVVTAYHGESRRLIERCLDSVKRQSVAVDHIVVADGLPQDWIDGAGVRHIRLDRSHGDYGNTPRGVGALLAVAEDYDAIAFLDSDNWFEPDHLALALAAGTAPGAACDYVIGQRNLMRPDETVIPLLDEPIGSHVDTSCFVFLPGAYHAVQRFALIPRQLSGLGDRIFYQWLRDQNLRSAVIPAKTVNYHCLWSSIYAALGETPPEGAKPNVDQAPMMAWIAGLSAEHRVAVNRRTGLSLA